jgi:transposase
MKITNEQWELAEPIIRKKRLGKWGRPRIDDRKILDGILWILKTGAQWSYLPRRYPPYQTCHRRFQEWIDRGIFDEILETLAMDMEYRGKLRLKDCFLDGAFASAKKGALELDLQSVGKEPKSWQFR